MGKLISDAQTAYNAWAAANKPTDVEGWTTITSEQALNLWKTEQTYLAAIEDARLIETSFYEARSAAFTAFEATKQSEFVALQQLWQSKEDNDFDVDYGDE